MNRTVVTVALASAFATAAFAAEPPGPSCADYAGMDRDGRMASMEAMHEAMRGMMGGMMGGAGAMMMEPGEMMGRASEACEAHPNGTVGEAMEMMKPD